MVTKKSILEARSSNKVWLKEHPRASLKEHLTQIGRTVKRAYEVDIRLATVPSLIAPMPKSAVDKLHRRIKRV